MKPLISVIIPLYNKEAFIENTLNSVLKQNFTDFEIIIVNDGSTDKSLPITETYLKDFSNKTIISQENQGLSATRNNAITIAKGEIIALLDADDLWEPNYLNELVLLSTTHKNADLFGSDYIEYFSKNIQLKPNKNIDSNKKNTSFLIEDFFKSSQFQPITVPSSFAFRRKVFESITFNENIDFAEDIDFYIKSNLSYKMAFSYKPLVISRQDIPNQMTKVGFKNKSLPELDQYESQSKTHKNLKKYLDINRYYFLIQCKINNDSLNAKKMRLQLNTSNLTSKQRFLLNIPVWLLVLLKKIKATLLTKRIKVTTY